MPSAAAAWLEGLIDVEKSPDLPYARLGLEPIRAPAGKARRSPARPARDPHRRLEGQGLDGALRRGLVARGGSARRNLHLAASRTLERALPHRRRGGRGCGPRRGRAPPAPRGRGAVRAGCEPRSDLLRRHDGGGSLAVPRGEGGPRRARGRSRRAPRLDQRGRARGRLHHDDRARAHGQAGGHARADRRREGRHPQAGGAGGRRSATRAGPARGRGPRP